MTDTKRRLERKGDSNKDKLFELLSFCLEYEVNVELNFVWFEMAKTLECVTYDYFNWQLFLILIIIQIDGFL